MQQIVPQDRALPTPGYVHELDTPLLMFSDRDVWTLRDAAEGVFITGGIGAGKSSSSGAMLARSYLQAGFGGIVCCVNTDEVDRWRRYAAETGRSQSLIIVDRTLEHRFNFMEYQLVVGRGSIFEAVRVLIDILNAAEGRHDGGDSKDQFWQQAMRELLGKSLAPLWAAYGRVTLGELMRFVQQRPTTSAQLDPEGDWIKQSFWAQTMSRAEDQPVHPMDPEDYEPVWDYWTKTMLNPDQRTPGNIVQTLTARLDPFLSGDLRRIFCTHSTFVPELTFEGAVIVLDLSAHAWGEEGILGQHIVKTLWQRAIQRRPKTPEARPCFLFCDECQYLMAACDQAYQSTARSCKALTVYLTQNLPGVYARLGPQAADVADAFLGNLATKIFHSQPDHRTAEWAANLIGKGLTWRATVGENEGASRGTGGGTSGSRSSGGGGSQSGSNSNWQQGSSRGTSRGASQVIDYRLQPSHFATLRKGGGPDKTAEAVVFQAGRVFGYTGATWTPVLFRQS